MVHVSCNKFSKNFLFTLTRSLSLCVCVQDPFQVSDNMGRFARLKERHVFLFEKVIIVSKKVEAPIQPKKQKKSDAYIYKDHIQVECACVRACVRV